MSRTLEWSKQSFWTTGVIDGDHAILFFLQKKQGEAVYFVFALEAKKPSSVEDVDMARELFASHAHEVVGDRTYGTLAMAKLAAEARGEEWLANRRRARRKKSSHTPPVQCRCGDIQ